MKAGQRLAAVPKRLFAPASKRIKNSFRCRNCRGTGIYQRCSCWYCFGKGFINWDILLDQIEAAAGNAHDLIAEITKLRRDFKKAKAHEAEMDLVVNHFLRSIDPDVKFEGAGYDGGGHLTIQASRRSSDASAAA